MTENEDAMLISMRRFGIGASYDIGVWFIRYRKYVIALRAPWDEPLFSERYGCQKTLASFRRWRLLWRVPQL
jgi:hypothetical protein